MGARPYVGSTYCEFIAALTLPLLPVLVNVFRSFGGEKQQVGQALPRVDAAGPRPAPSAVLEKRRFGRRSDAAPGRGKGASRLGRSYFRRRQAQQATQAQQAAAGAAGALRAAGPGFRAVGSGVAEAQMRRRLRRSGGSSGGTAEAQARRRRRNLRAKASSSGTRKRKAARA